MSYPYSSPYNADSHVQDALIKKLWAKTLWAEAQKESYWAKFTSKVTPSLDKMDVEGFNNIICQMDDLTKDQGDEITIPLVMKLKEKGVTGDNILEGNEEKMEFHDYKIKIEQYRHAVRLRGKKAEQESAVLLRPTAKQLLKTWMVELRDKKQFDSLSANPTAGRYLVAGDNDNPFELESSDVLSTSLITLLRRKAQMAYPKIRPVIIDGKAWYVMVVSPFQIESLKNETRYRESQISALPRGVDHPIFTGASGAWDGVIIHEHENVWWRSGSKGTEELISETESTTGTESGEDTPFARALFLGAQAGCVAYAQHPEWVEETFDYGNKWGYATSIIFETGKPKFNGKDYGVIAVDTYINVPAGVLEPTPESP